MVSGLPGTPTARRGRGLGFPDRPAGRPQGSLKTTSSQRPARLCAGSRRPPAPPTAAGADSAASLLPPRRSPAGTAGAARGRGHRTVIAGPTGDRHAPPASRASAPDARTPPRAGPSRVGCCPPRRAAVDARALARGQGVRGPERGPPASRPLLALALALLLLPLPAGAWYKHVASPRYHTVGRAAGLLMGLRRSPYVWRRALRAAAGTPAWDAFAPGAAARDALLLRFPGLWEPWEAPRRSFTAGRPVRAPRSPPALEWRPGPRSPSAADPARPFGETDPAPPPYPQRIPLAGPRLARGQL